MAFHFTGLFQPAAIPNKTTHTAVVPATAWVWHQIRDGVETQDIKWSCSSLAQAAGASRLEVAGVAANIFRQSHLETALAIGLGGTNDGSWRPY